MDGAANRFPVLSPHWHDSGRLAARQADAGVARAQYAPSQRPLARLFHQPSRLFRAPAESLIRFGGQREVPRPAQWTV